MTSPHLIKSLEDVTFLLDREVDRCSADMTRRRGIRARYVASLKRLEQIYRSSGVPLREARPWALHALNCDAFKLGVSQLVEAHRLDLALHDADAAVMQRTLTAAVRRREGIGVVLEREREALQRERARRERRAQDETAVQAWSRTHP
jgi:flagellar export protein FliJ